MSMRSDRPLWMQRQYTFASHRILIGCRASSLDARQPNPPSLPLAWLTGAASCVIQKVTKPTITTEQAADWNLYEDDINAQIKANLSQMRALALVAPFAAVSGSGDVSADRKLMWQ